MQAKPQAEKFWLSYIDALIEPVFTDAKQALTDGRQSGVSAEKVSVLWPATGQFVEEFGQDRIPDAVRKESKTG